MSPYNVIASLCCLDFENNWYCFILSSWLSVGIQKLPVLHTVVNIWIDWNVFYDILTVFQFASSFSYAAIAEAKCPIIILNNVFRLVSVNVQSFSIYPALLLNLSLTSLCVAQSANTLLLVGGYTIDGGCGYVSSSIFKNCCNRWTLVSQTPLFI